MLRDFGYSLGDTLHVAVESRLVHLLLLLLLLLESVLLLEVDLLVLDHLLGLARVDWFVVGLVDSPDGQGLGTSEGMAGVRPDVSRSQLVGEGADLRKHPVADGRAGLMGRFAPK